MAGFKLWGQMAVATEMHLWTNSRKSVPSKKMLNETNFSQIGNSNSDRARMIGF